MDLLFCRSLTSTMRTFLTFFGFLSLFSTASANGLDSLEAEMAKYQSMVAEGATDAARQEASENMRTVLIAAFAEDSVFEHPFYKLNRMACITSFDGAFRLFNWNQPHLDGTQSYYAFILFPEKGAYVELKDNADLDDTILNKTLTPDEWYGALYYEIFPVKHKGETFYSIMGWDGNDNLSNKKILDVLNIDKKQHVTLGRPIYQLGDDFVNRRVFEYAEQARINLRYLIPKEAIIYDRLQPEKSGLEGQYEYYIPSTTYDGYVLNNKGLWELHEYFDMTRPKSAETGAQFNFPDKVNFERKRSDTDPLRGK